MATSSGGAESGARNSNTVFKSELDEYEELLEDEGFLQLLEFPDEVEEALSEVGYSSNRS